MQVSIMHPGKGRIAVKSPYHPEFVKRARALNGSWNRSKKVWTFDRRDESRVEKILSEIYGYGASQTADVQYVLSEEELYSQRVFALGRLLVERKSRDYTPSLGEGVIVAEGKFPERGGSRNNPRLGGKDITLEVRDVPYPLIEMEDEERTKIVRISDSTPPEPKSVEEAYRLVQKVFRDHPKFRASEQGCVSQYMHVKSGGVAWVSLSRHKNTLRVNVKPPELYDFNLPQLEALKAVVSVQSDIIDALESARKICPDYVK